MSQRYRIAGDSVAWLVADGITNTTVRVWDETSGADEAFSALTYTLTNPAGTAVISAAAVGSGTGEVTYAVTLSSQTPGIWQARWVATIAADSSTAELYQTVAVAPIAVQPSITTHDLLQRESRLDEVYASGQTSWKSHIDAAWDDITLLALHHAAGPDLWTSTHLRQPHLYRSLALVFSDLSTFAGDDYDRKAVAYGAMGDEWWERMKVQLDTDNDGDRDSDVYTPIPTRGPAPFGRRG